MRLASYIADGQEARAALMVAQDGRDVIVDLARASNGSLPHDLDDIVRLGAWAMERVRAIAEHPPVGRPIDSVTLTAPIRRPGKLVCIAGNFQRHVEEGGGARVDKERAVPKLFLKPTTTIAGPRDRVDMPPVAAAATDWELELAVVIGSRGRHVSVADALDLVLGYAVINDLSARRMAWDVPGRQPAGWDAFFDWLSGKWVDGYAPLGPWITTADEVRDPTRLGMELRVNDHVWQHGSTADMIFSAAEIIAFGSQFMTWEPGDIIAGGTLDGTGDPSGVYLAEGDIVAGRIEGLGSIETRIGLPESA